MSLETILSAYTRTHRQTEVPAFWQNWIHAYYPPSKLHYPLCLLTMRPSAFLRVSVILVSFIDQHQIDCVSRTWQNQFYSTLPVEQISHMLSPPQLLSHRTPMESRWKDPKNSKKRSSSCFSVFYVLLFLDTCTGFRFLNDLLTYSPVTQLCFIGILYCTSCTAGLHWDQADRFNPTVFCNLVKQPKPSLLLFLGLIIAMLSLLALLRFSLTKFKKRSTAHIASSAKVLNLPTLLLCSSASTGQNQQPDWIQNSSNLLPHCLQYNSIVSSTTPQYALSVASSLLSFSLSSLSLVYWDLPCSEDGQDNRADVFSIHRTWDLELSSSLCQAFLFTISF